MKKHLTPMSITLLTFTLLIAFLLSGYSLSDFEKTIFAIFISIALGYLFHLKMNAEKMIVRLQKAANISKVGFWSLDLVKDELYWSQEIFDIFEIDSKNFQPSYASFLHAIHPDDRELVNDAYTTSLKTKENYSIQHRLLLSGGRIKWVKEECETEFDKSGKPLLSIGIITDITTEVEHLHAVEESESSLSSIINSIDDIIFFKDKDFKYLGCNEAFLKFVGKTKEEMIGHYDYELVSKDMSSVFREMDIKTLETNEVSSGYAWLTYPNGKKYYNLIKKIPFNYHESDIGVLGIGRDITALHLSQQKIELQSYVDDLTKLNNRKSYNERVEELLALKKRYKTPFSMIIYDIDDFKYINDTYGHKVGDNVLVKMSALIKSLLRESDYLFRLGGEEFVILLTETNLENAKKVALKVCKSVEENLKTITDNKITISVGVSEVNESDTEDTIFKRVDDLLYKSKLSGKNRVSF